MNRRWLGPAFIAAALLFSLAVYGRLPERIATHFGPNGEPDGWSSRGVAAFGVPAFAIFLLALFHMLPRMLPRRANIEQFADTYWAIVTIVIAFMVAMHVMILGIALGWPVHVPTAVLLGIGGMFVILGTFMPHVKSNWLLGIRTPWTLESETVWRETHRLAGRTMMAGGIITMIGAFLPAALQPWVGMGGLLLGAFTPVIYSYILWRREARAPGT
jgi:uncharacterized membrane protein